MILSALTSEGCDVTVIQMQKKSFLKEIYYIYPSFKVAQWALWFKNNSVFINHDFFEIKNVHSLAKKFHTN